MGQLHFDSSISEMRYLASKTIFSDSPFARMITGLMKVLPFGCSSLFTGDIISFQSKILSNLNYTELIIQKFLTMFCFQHSQIMQNEFDKLAKQLIKYSTVYATVSESVLYLLFVF